MGATLMPSQGPLRIQISVNFSYVKEVFDVDRIKGLGVKIEGSGAQIGASGVKISALVPTAQNFSSVILTHGGYFEALSGAPKDPSFGQIIFMSENSKQTRSWISMKA